MQTRVRIERIRADQGLLLRDLRLRSLADAPEAFGQPIDEARLQPEAEWHQSARQAAAGDSRTWLLATAGDEAVGLVQGRKRRPATLLLFSMWIEPRLRHHGLATALIDALEAWGVGWGARETRLWVYASNTPAIAFYSALGFTTVRSGEDRERGAQFGADAMRRDIDRRRF